MKNVRFIIFLLLVPFAFLLASCDNDMSEEFILEVHPESVENYNHDNPFKDIDYFMLSLYKVDLDKVSSDIPQVGAGTTEYPQSPVFEGKRLNKGDILRLDSLEPGYYYMEAKACCESDLGYSDRHEVIVKSNNSITVPVTQNGGTAEFIVVEPGVPTIIKFSIKFGSP
ncbi:MAG: hypothetical protein J6Y60_06815 [Treponema sp.]|nr:hypothetical protein [Treponema sp.]